MCGFAALFAPGHVFPEQLLGSIEKDLMHRGPDSGGSAKHPGWALVFRRLAILDPRAESDQPMTSPDGRCTLVYNGELYNYRELREELTAAGETFRTTGDTEVLLRGYLRWGEAVLDRLEGMYAFVIVDHNAGRALIARDPFGIKPLYLLRSGKLLAVASEMRPLLHLTEPRVDETALAELLTFGWAAGHLSNLEGIERFPGGMQLTVQLAGGSARWKRHCDVLDTIREDGTNSDQESERRAGHALKNSVKAHLASDVGYAVQLSGGLDSSLISALATKFSFGRVASFSINLGDHPLDESQYRRLVVERYDLDHHEIHLTGRDFADAMPRAIKHMEGPVPHLGCVMLMLLCERLKHTSKVVLTGEGADEMFGGYLRYAAWRRIYWQALIGRWVPAHVLPRTWPFLGVRRLSGTNAAVYASVYQNFAAMHRLFPEFIPRPGAREAAVTRFSSFRDRLFAVDQTAYLESLLVRQDKMAMAASVEARVPYVHLPLARVLNSLPRKVRAPGKITKPLLKRIARPYLPSELIGRRKVGLLLPYDEWLEDEKGLGRYLELLTEPSSRLRQYASSNGLAETIDAFRAGKREGLPSVIGLVNVELWLRSLERCGSVDRYTWPHLN